jgi:SET domain-containing protein
VTGIESDGWLRPSIQIESSPLHGRGWFAAKPIPAGETIARLGGRVVSDDELRELLAQRLRDPSLPYVDTVALDRERHLVLPTGTAIHYGNHGCDPNAWWTDGLTVAARRDISRGDEITTDYGTSAGDPSWQMTCSCSAASCRGVITGRDWQLTELQVHYGHHWVPALQKLIHSANAGP